MEQPIKPDATWPNPGLTEEEFVNDIQEIAKRSLVDNLELTLKEYSSPFESFKYLNIKYINETQIIDIDFIFSSTYNHPVIYFLIYDHEGNVVPISDVFSYMFEAKYNPDVDVFVQKVSQKKHPFISSLSYFIHPCEMSKYFEQIYKPAEAKSTSKTFFWLSIYMQILKISLPLKFYEQNKIDVQK